ncbi:Fe-S cluster assembly protein HesB [Candidatus Gracilibacteria bacterium]|nr:Fe-S cluster assembly protein HesB [Candidatus Gracilibacteria bacterium]
MNHALINIYTQLRAFFGPLHGPDAAQPWWPLFGENAAFEIVLGAVLVQQTRWEAVEGAIERLFANGYRTPADFATAQVEELIALLRPVAFPTQKAVGLVAIAQHFVAYYKGDVLTLLARSTMELRSELLALPRIGRETADVIMLYASGHAIFVVDEYTRRLGERVAPEALPWRAPYDTLRIAIEGELARTDNDHAPLYADFHAQINEVCVRFCLSKPRCDGPPARRVYSHQPGRNAYLDRHDGCPLRAVCAFYQKELSIGALTAIQPKRLSTVLLFDPWEERRDG